MPAAQRGHDEMSRVMYASRARTRFYFSSRVVFAEDYPRCFAHTTRLFSVSRCVDSTPVKAGLFSTELIFVRLFKKKEGVTPQEDTRDLCFGHRDLLGTPKDLFLDNIPLLRESLKLKFDYREDLKSELSLVRPAIC